MEPVSATSQVTYRGVEWSTLSSNLACLVQDLVQAKLATIALPYIESKEAFFRVVQEQHCNDARVCDSAMRSLQRFDEQEFRWVNHPSNYAKILKENGIKNREAWNRVKEYEEAHQLTQIFLQRSDNFDWKKNYALQQIADDMWNAFVASADFCNSTPLAKWAANQIDPWMLPNHCMKKQNTLALEELDEVISIVSFPSCYSARGVLSWPMLAHDIAHTILEKRPEAKEILSEAIRQILSYALECYVGMHSENLRVSWTHYWESRLTEISADIMAILYMGPAAAIGLIAFLRSYRQDHALSSQLNAEDPHLADILRGLLAAYTVSYLNISDPVKEAWRDYLLDEVKKDSELNRIDWELANQCAHQVAYTVIHTPMFDGKSLKEIKCWDLKDEELVSHYLESTNVKAELTHYKASHLIASANLYLLTNVKLKDSSDSRIPAIFEQMMESLFEVGQLQKPGTKPSSFVLKHGNVYSVCPAPLVKTDSSALTPSDSTRGKNKTDLIPIVLGVTLIGLFGILLTKNSGK